MTSDTKLDASFPTSQKMVISFNTDQVNIGDAILVYVREDIASKLTANFPNAEGIFLDINLIKKKWIISCSCNSNNQTIFLHMERMGKAVDSFSSKYENFLVIGDFNAKAKDTSVKDFCDIYSFQHLIKEVTR